MGQTIVETIAQKHMTEGPARPLRTGDFLSIRPHRCMTHDNTSAVMSKFKGIGAKKVKDSQQLTFALDHDIQNRDEANLKKYRAIEAFAKEQGVDFYPAGSDTRSWSSAATWSPVHSWSRRIRIPTCMARWARSARLLSARMRPRCGRRASSGGRFRGRFRSCWKVSCRKESPART